MATPEKITIAELDFNTDALTKSAAVTKRELEALKKEQKELKNSTEDTTDAQIKNEIATKKLSKQYREQTKVLSALTDENNEYVEAEKAVNTELNKEIKSIDQARDSNKKLLALRSSLNLKTDSGRKAQAALNAKLDENNKFIKENVSGYEAQKIGIGDYEGALRRVFPQLGGVVDGLKNTVSGLRAQKAAMQASTAASTGTTKALGFFRIALISTGVGAIVVALGALIAAFASTQKGADSISKALAPIKGALQAIKGIIQDVALNVFSQLGDRWTIVSSSILNGIDFIRLGWAKLSGDTEGAAEATARVAKRTEEIAQAQENLIAKNEALNDIRKNSVQRLKDAAAAQQEIVALQIQIEQSENRLIVSRSRSNTIIKENNKIAEDTTKTLEDREAAAQRAIEESGKLLKAEQDILDLQIKKVELQNSLNDTSREDEKALAELQAKRNEAETQQLELQTTLTNKLNIIRTAGAAIEAKKVEEKKAADAAELTRLQAFEDQKRELQNQIDLESAATNEEKEILKAEQDLEKKTLALERLQLDEEEKTELLALLQTQQDQRLAAIKEENAAKTLKSEEAIEKKRIQIKSKSFDAAVGLAGAETKLGQGLLALKEIFAAKEAILELKKVSFKSKTALANSSTAIAEGTAQTAKVGFPQNIPLLLGFAAQAVGIISAVKNAGKIADSAAFYEGGVAGGVPTGAGGRISNAGNIPTQQGGDNILATLKTGEVILNDDQQHRAGGSAFFQSIGVPGFQGGGQAGGATVPTISQASKINMEEFANVIADRVNSIKVVAIEQDITNAQAIQAEIVDGASF